MESSGTMSQCSHIIRLLSRGLSSFKIHFSEQGFRINNEN